jgi:hypothetical protein
MLRGAARRQAQAGLALCPKPEGEILAAGPMVCCLSQVMLLPMTSELEIIDGPTFIPLIHVPGSLYRWKIQNGTAEQHVYVQIADALRPEGLEEPLRSSVETKGESVLRRLLERHNVPTRIKITSAGITEVGIDRRSRPCAL